MIINNLQVENFKSHSHTQIDFDTGISIIMGENGAGKSTILEAISFALFKQHASRSLQHLVRAGQTKMKVELEFVVNGRTYRVLREKGKSSSKATLELKEGNGFHTLMSGDKLVNLEIQKLLEMDGDLFLNAVYVRQGEIADLIEKTQSEKKQLIGKLLGIESLEKAWKNMATLIKDYEGRKENFKGRLEAMADLKENLKKNKEKKASIEADIQKIRSEINEIIIELEKLKKDRDEMYNNQLLFHQIQTQIDSKKGLLSQAQARELELSTEIKTIMDNEKLMLEIEPEINRLADLRLIKEALSNLSSLNTEKGRIEVSLKKIESFNKILTDNQTYFDEYNLIQDKIQDISEKRAEYAGARDLMNSKKTTQSQLQKKIEKLVLEIDNLFTQANTALESDLDTWEDLEKQLGKIKVALDIKINSLNQEITHHKQQISNLEGLNQSIQKPLKELKSVEGQCPVCKSDIDEAKKNELVDGYRGEMDDNKNNMDKLRSSLVDMESEKSNLESKSRLIQAINIDVIKEKSASLKSARKELDETETEIDQLTLNVSQLAELDASLSSKKSRINEIKEFYNQFIRAQGGLESTGDLADYHGALIDISSQIDDINNEIAKLAVSAGIESLKKGTLITDTIITDTLITDTVADINTEISRLTELNNQYQQMKGRVDKKVALEEQLNTVRSSIKKINEEIDTFTGSLSNIPYDDNVYKNLMESFENKNQEFLDSNGKEKELSGVLSGVEENIQNLEEEMSNFKKYKAELTTLNDFIKLLNTFRDLYGKDGIQKDLRNMSKPLIEQNTRNFFEKFNFDYSDISLDEDYNIDVYGPLGKTSMDMISGGERIAVALALRLGITKALSGGNLELIMLDEPTIHLDSYRRQELIDILKRMSIIPQMIIVTHDMDLEEAADNIIKVEKDDGNSQVICES